MPKTETISYFYTPGMQEDSGSITFQEIDF